MIESQKQAIQNCAARRINRRFAGEIAALSKLKPRRSFQAILFDWVVILVSAGLASYIDHLLGYIIAILLIASRQHALFVLTHEGAHKLIHSKLFINDTISNVFCAFPLFVRTESYRNHHRSHHQFLNTDRDPDWVRKIARSEWQFPQTTLNFSKNLGKYILGYGFVEVCFFILGLNKVSKPYRTAKIAFAAAYYTSALAMLLYFDLFFEFTIFWLIPYAYLLPLLNRVRSIAEHFGLGQNSIFTQSRTIIPPRLEAFFFAPHHVNYHLDHHLVAAVPFYNLPKLHQHFRSFADYRNHAHINDSYSNFGKNSLLTDILKGKAVLNEVY
ncbi:fatty acid desaturase family protein [Pseudobacteriovorax antillogorgiicola]|uniref:Fatty acid desaturase n=1 Tax=Pseudobacteriovorax antillogorgiicola TaxID=1513793 RepID=A0A1Y6CTH4_9BACT|nr:fatty acid desaturase family protein [Pseudobacteriovorax antillogorgiicola]TCS45681.1 fatty acid desaturase [Pseudobacteriovorax antillogorgiicola]SMF73155.1 Fatty acid desaturase [Pseudobacteriovorax antillogorgiicola]